MVAEDDTVLVRYAGDIDGGLYFSVNEKQTHLVSTLTYHHVCIPRRVRQRCTDVHPQLVLLTSKTGVIQELNNFRVSSKDY